MIAPSIEGCAKGRVDAADWDNFLHPVSKGGTNLMSGRHSFSELTKDFTPERRQRIAEIKSELLAEMPLHELRRARARPRGTWRRC